MTLLSSGSATGSACFPVLGIEVHACNEQKHKDVVSTCIKQNRSVNKRNITGKQEEMDTDAEEDSEENGWTCDIGVSCSSVAGGSSLVQCDTMLQGEQFLKI